MKKLIIIFLLSSFFIFGDSSHKVIKFLRFGKISYDYYSSFEIKDKYCIYYNTAIGANPTNYIYGEFQLLTYNEYIEDIKYGNRTRCN